MKTIFIDIDGTLYNSKRQLSKKNKEVLTILKNMGVNCFLVSGRPRYKTKMIAQESNAGNYIISSTGADIYDLENNKTIFQSSLNTQSIKEIYKAANEKKAKVDLISGFTIYTNYKDESNPFKKEIKEIDFIDNVCISQILIQDSDYKKILHIRDNILPNFKDVEVANQTKALYNSNLNINDYDNFYLDINSPTVSKASAIKILCKKLNINLKDIVCIGDSMNDLSMFRIAGKSVAMENSVDSIKAIADVITLSNDEDGVAAFLIREFNLKL